jgi:HPt (histidine-containing phosphotransfer) domain-containing protein
MFLLPITPSPGEHGAEDHTGGLIMRARRSCSRTLHMDVNGFILCALLIQAFAVAGVVPVEVWRAEPGYALLVCLGLVTVSASILFSLRSLLTEPVPVSGGGQSDEMKLATSAPAAAVAEAGSPECERSIVALVVHRSRTLQAVIENSLLRAGIPCLSVQDESAAEKALSARSICLLVMEAESVSSARAGSSAKLSALCRARGIPVLEVTSGTAAGSLTADACVSTPLVPDELARTALSLLKDKRSGAGVPSPNDTLSQREIPKLEAEPLDPRALGDLEKLGGRDFVRDIVEQFVADAALVLAGLVAAVTRRDAKSFREQAHALRSCAANVGAHNIYRMCLTWRDLDAQEIAASGVEYMHMLEQEFQRVRDALTPMLQQDDGGPGPDSKAA